MAGVNDNNAGARGRAIVNLLRWLDDGETMDADELMGVLELLDLNEADIECICRHFGTGRTVLVPYLGTIS